MIETRLAGRVTIAEGNTAAALEVMSRYAAHPRWLPYLPPTMSPVETSRAEGYLERPEEAFSYFANCGVATVVCQEKHMGSRAVFVVCRDSDAARRRFGASGSGETGVVVTRTGRPFFSDAALGRALVAETAAAIGAAGLWDEWDSDWCCLDAEILPWNAKARGLLREQYAPVAAAARRTLPVEEALARAAAERGVPGAAEIADRLVGRVANVNAYADAYGRYCWTTDGLDGLKVAPFHVLAVEGRTLLDRDHHYHIGACARLAAVTPRFHATDTLTVQLGDPESRAHGVRWWEEKTAAGGEGMVVKPLAFLPPRKCQPAVKVRGREYLRIIYGPEYTSPENLERLRVRGLSAKRALANKEFALGVEAIERFVAREPLRRVHECVFGVLALESEPVNPRL